MTRYGFLKMGFVVGMTAFSLVSSAAVTVMGQQNYNLYVKPRPDSTPQGPGYTKTPILCLYIDYKGERTVSCSGALKYETDALTVGQWVTAIRPVASFPIIKGEHALLEIGKGDGHMRNFDHSGVIVKEN